MTGWSVSWNTSYQTAIWKIDHGPETCHAITFFNSRVCRNFAARGRNFQENNPDEEVTAMRFLKALFNIGKSAHGDQDSFSVALNRLARVQPTRIGQTAVFTARPRSRAA